jgi:acetyltransferase-like isoleucine patch superfamily enzyme
MVVGSGVRMVGCRIRLKGSGNRLILGDNVRLRELFIEITGTDNRIEIGRNTHIGQRSYIIAGERNNRISIGESCALASGIKIRSTDGHDVLFEGQRTNPARDIVIGDRVWFGDNVTVLKGVTVGSDSVLGIDAVVTRPVPCNAVAVGNPARVVRHGITWREELTF